MHARAVCLCHARVRSVALRGLSVCTVVYVVPFFRVRGSARVRVPWQRPAKSRTPTLRVDTSPPRM